MKKSYTLIVALLLAACTFAQVQSIKKAPYQGNAGIKKKISELRVTQENTPQPGTLLEAQQPSESINGLASNAASNVPALTNLEFGRSSFLSIFREHAPGQPGTVPDPSGAVGPTQVVVATNMGIRVFKKPSVTDAPIITPTGYSTEVAPSLLSIGLGQFFAAVLPAGSNAVHPQVRYDRLTKRWFITAVEENPARQKNLIMLAVSNGDQFTDAAVFTFFAFNSSIANGLTTPYLDVPTVGVDRHALLISGTQIMTDTINSVGYVVDKPALLQDQLVVHSFELGGLNERANRTKGMTYPVAVNNDDPTATASFFIGHVFSSSTYQIVTLGYDNTRKPVIILQVSSLGTNASFARDISTPGSMAPLYTFAINDRRNRMLQATIFKNKLTGISSLWTAQNVGTNQVGGFDPFPPNPPTYIRQARTGTRWYQINEFQTRTPKLVQFGTVYDNKEPSGRRAVQYFNATIAANGQGHVLIGGTTAAYNEFLNVYITGRHHDDQPGFTYPPMKVTNSNAIYAPFLIDRSVGSRGNRIFSNGWGDYSQTVVDPLDDQTFWTFQQYANVDDGYGIRALQFKAPPPAMPSSPGTLSNKSDTTLLIQATSSNGSGFFDPGQDQGGPGFNRLSVKSTGDISVSNIKMLSATQLSVRLQIKNKPAGSYQLTITNPDGQAATVGYSIESSSTSAVARNVQVQSVKQKKLTSASVSDISVFPNPARQNCILTVTGTKDFNARVVLMDANGKQLAEQRHQINKGLTRIEMPTDKLAPGTYFALLYNTGNKLAGMQKIVKQ